MKRTEWMTLGALAAVGALVLEAARPRRPVKGNGVLITGGSRGLGLEVARV